MRTPNVTMLFSYIQITHKLTNSLRLILGAQIYMIMNYTQLSSEACKNNAEDIDISM